MSPIRNKELDRLIDEMVARHCDFIHGYGTLIRKAYDLGRSDERLGLTFDQEERVKKLNTPE